MKQDDRAGDEAGTAGMREKREKGLGHIQTAESHNMDKRKKRITL
jgi:hypothetical protein